MSARDAKFYIGGALATLICGLIIVVAGHVVGWGLVSIGVFNAAMGIYRLRKAPPPLR